MLHEVVLAGFGGQGVMSMGQLLAYAGMLQDYHVSWLPSYGPEQRGGTANCAVIISDEPVGAPVVNHPTAAIVLNNPSFDKFEPTVLPDGILIVNSALIDRKSTRTDIQVIEIPANDIAAQLGNTQIANMILLGAFIELTKAVSIDAILESLKKVLPERRHHLIPLNKQALEKGAELCREHLLQAAI
ncbi:2-oxoacid:acceptor oxidoreductase family protein [Brevibacillus sp. SYSU BS000544]|uniref:2-oxoacid:acceptor oxidoreductase family protein n=1 Tax=Brevibacillus sp. SYSU BS000544 TaxID=3416443 RepID=UPI003CE533B0